jgi:hypothetical protein
MIKRQLVYMQVFFFKKNFYSYCHPDFHWRWEKERGKRAKEAKDDKGQEDPERTKGRGERRRVRGILSGQRHLTEPSTDLIGRELAAGEHDGHTGTRVSTRVKMSQRKEGDGCYLAPTK